MGKKEDCSNYRNISANVESVSNTNISKLTIYFQYAKFLLLEQLRKLQL
jgi:hypothetical protein